MMDRFDNVVGSKIQLVGHTDAMGENNYNNTLGLTRAEAMINIMVLNPTVSADLLALKNKSLTGANNRMKRVGVNCFHYFAV